MKFFAIFWDLADNPRGNTAHCTGRGLTQAEIDEVLQNPTDEDTSHSSGYPVVFGDTSTGRHLMVVYELIEPDIAYPITAYEVPKKVQP